MIDYYDSVVLQGLKLAVEDQAKGTIDTPRAQKMTRSMLSVIDDLDGHADAATDQTSPGATPIAGRAACVAGRGPFDDAVSTMLAQLLKQRGVASHAIGNAKVSREGIAQLDLSGIDVIAISYLELAGSPAELRYLIRRLRQRAPTAKIIVGLWPDGEAALTDAGIQRAIGADLYIGSLHAAVAAILEEFAPDTAAITPEAAAA